MALLRRIQSFITPPPADPAIAALYGACVAQARTAEFYRVLGVPDTLDGRFDLLLLHVFLIMRRLDGKSSSKQALFDLMFADIDRSLREMGVGDMSVGKKMRPMISAFYGRAQAYEKALADDTALAEALRRNLYGKTEVDPDKVKLLASYVRQAANALEKEPMNTILTGRITFPAIQG